MKEGDFKSFELIHHLTAGLKAYATEMCYNGTDEMRQACGGAGFLMSSGVAQTWADISLLPTAEGANTVMFG